MDWRIDKTRPVCPQIEDEICLRIVTGEYEPDGKLCSVREAAAEAGVNPNTVQKAFESLEAQGLIYSMRGSGWFACSDRAKAVARLEALRQQAREDYFTRMTRLGMTPAEAADFIKEEKHE